MKLIAILLSLAVDRFYQHIVNLRRFDWLIGYGHWLCRILPESAANGPVPVLLLLLGPALLVAVIMYLLNTFFGLLFAIVVLMYCIGPKQLEQDIKHLSNVETDPQSMEKAAAAMIEGKFYNHQDDTTGKVVDALLVEANDRYFNVLFWFIVIGPVGAVLYRCASVFSQALIKQQDPDEQRVHAAVTAHKVLDWIPANLTALSYTITGSFTHAFENWHKTAFFDANESINAAVLVETGRGSVLFQHEHDSFDAQVQAVIGLIWRTLWLWVVLVAIFTLAGWLQ